MTDPLPSLDLRLTPDWLKESEPGNRYADYVGDDAQDRHHRGRRDRRDDRPRRPSPPNDRPRRGSSDRGPAANNRSPQPPASPAATAPGSSETANQKPFRSDRSRFQRREEPALRPEAEPAPVQIDFLPEERAFSKIIQQIKLGHIAYPLFGLARMFLERPERHRIRVRSLDNHTMIYQLGDDGPVAMDSAALERNAFNEKREEYYGTEIVEKEPIKGNFSSVARCTLSGKLLGPTNYHAFQPALRTLYDQRFSRRMSFDDYRRAIEISSDPQLVEQWKEEARKSVTFQTKDQENPAAFDNLAAVEQHFRTNYLPALIRRCLATELSGDMARHLPDRGIIAAIRKARDRENRFPAQIAGALRHGLNQAGLHVFKHKKRILYISTVRPQLFDANQASVSTGLSVILSTIKSYPKISRKQLAEKALVKLIGEKSTDESSEEYLHAKTTLATDLIWLAKAGHVIEFADGTLDLPLPPRSLETSKGGANSSAQRGPDGDESDGASDEEPATVLLETGELSGESKTEMTSDAHTDQIGEVILEEPEPNPESSLEPMKREAASEPPIQSAVEPPDLPETKQETLERVPSHAT
jgi:hypothetical protein